MSTSDESQFQTSFESRSRYQSETDNAYLGAIAQESMHLQPEAGNGTWRGL